MVLREISNLFYYRALAEKPKIAPLKTKIKAVFSKSREIYDSLKTTIKLNMNNMN